MEINEIVNPYFSFPVVGVVICAVLVYAFGFKAPAQPPSFDFDNDRKSTGSKKRKVTKKSLTNGHATAVVTAVAAANAKPAVVNADVKVAKSSSPKVRSNATSHSNSASPAVSKTESPRAKVVVEKKGERGKKEKNAAKNEKGEEAVNVEKKPIEKKREEGEWVQLLSRKEKKNRKREEIVDDIKESLIAGNNKEASKKKRADSNTPSNSKENSPTKKKAPPKKNDVDKSKVMKEKLDNNAENKPQIAKAPIEKTISKSSENIKPAKAEVKPANLPDQNVTTSQKNKKSVNGSVPGENQVNVKESGDKKAKKEQKAPPPVITPPVNVEIKQEPEIKVETKVGKIAFDELGDWEETKTQKKKKKTRRDQ